MNILEVKNISKTYGKKKVLNQISLAVPQGKIYGLLGPNGAGKTTLIRIINQIIASDEGEVWFKGSPMTRNQVEKLGYLPEERGLYTKMKVGEHLIYMAQLRGIKSLNAPKVVKNYMREFDILDWWNMKVEQLSKGMQQKLQFIIAIMHSPDFVILDEPFSGFDPVNAEFIKNKILELKGQGVTFMLSTHRMDSVEELCDHVTLIHKANKVLDGEKHKIKSQFKTNKYEIIYSHTSRPVESETPVFQIISNEKNDNPDWMTLTVSLKPGRTVNELLHYLLDMTEIHAFRELIPGMNEIFISLVKDVENE